MRADCGRVDPGAVIRPDRGEWYPRMPDRLDEDELAHWRSGRDAIYQLAALTVGARLACQEKTPAGEPGFQGIAIEQGDLRSIADT